MEQKLNDIIFNNLQLLENSADHSIKANQFVNSQNELIKSPQLLINFLEREYLIEQELGVEDKYFLTEFGFNVLYGEKMHIPNLYEDELIELVKSCGETDEIDVYTPKYSGKEIRNNSRASSMEEKNGVKLNNIGIYVFIGFALIYVAWKYMALDGSQEITNEILPHEVLDSIKSQRDSL